MKRSAVCCGLRRMPRARHAPLTYSRPGTPMGSGRCLSFSTYACARRPALKGCDARFEDSHDGLAFT